MPDGIKISQLSHFPGKQFSDVVPFSGGDPFGSYAYTIQTLLNLGVTGLTGGGSANLDGTPTAEEAELQIWNVVTTGNLLSPYQLQTSVAAQNSPNIIRPLDFDSGNNPKVFQILGFKGLSLTLTGEAGAGFVEMLAQSGAPTLSATGPRLYADASYRPSWIQPDGYTRTLSSTLTASRVYTLPDVSTTLVGTTNPSGTTLANINSITSTAGANLVLALGTGGTALTLTTSTLAATFAGTLTVSGSTLTLGTTTSQITGAAGNMTITAGTGASRTLSLQSTTAGGTATTFLTGNADQTATFASDIYSTAGRIILIASTQGNVFTGRNNQTGAYVTLRDATTTGDGYVAYGAQGDSAVITAGAATRVTISSALTTLATNLTVSGTGTSSVAGSFTLSGATLTHGTDALASDTNYYINTAAGNSRYISWQTGGVNRWRMSTNSTAESGGNAGSNFVLGAYADNGSVIGSALSITRSTMAATFGGNLTMSGTLTGAATLTGTNSITAAASTDLTLAGGSSGASLVLGQGTGGAVTITPKGSGSVIVAPTSGDLLVYGVDADSGTTTRTSRSLGLRSSYWTGAAAAYRFWYLTNTMIDTSPNYALDFQNNGGSTLMRLGASGNVLVGTTTDMSSTAGGLYLNGTGSGSNASSSTTGALRVVGANGGTVGIGGGAIYTSADIVAGGTLTATTLNTSTNSASTIGIAGGSAEIIITPGSGITRGATTQLLSYSGGTDTNAGRMQVYGGSHGSKAGYLEFISFNAALLTVNNTNVTSIRPVSITDTTASTSTTTGALIVSGGVGIAKALHVGEASTITGNSVLNGTITVGNPGASTEIILTPGTGIARGTTTSLLGYRGGTDSNSGGMIAYGGSHGSKPGWNEFMSMNTAIVTMNNTDVTSVRPLVVSTSGAAQITATTSGTDRGEVLVAKSSGTAQTWSLQVAGSANSYSVADRAFALVNTTLSTVPLSITTHATNPAATFQGTLTVSGGNVGVGTAANAAAGIDLRPTGLSGSEQAGAYFYPVFTSSATVASTVIDAKVSTAAASFTTTSAYGINVSAPVVGAASAITTIRGLNIANQGAAGITNAIAIDIAAQSGAATLNIGLRNAGSTVLSSLSDGTLSVVTGVVTSSSDARLKIVEGPFKRGLAEILKLEPALFRWKAEESGILSDRVHAGFVAQDVQSVIPEAVADNGTGYLGLSDRPILGALVNAVKDLKAQNDRLREELAQLRAA